MSATERLEGTVERVVFANAETGWAVLHLLVRGQGQVTVVGELAGVQPGESVRVVGRWTRDPKFGRQVRVDSWETTWPSTYVGLERFLSSGQVEGIGPEIAKRLVAAFGLDTLDIIDRAPERLREVEGIGAVRSERIQTAWRLLRDVRDVMLFLQQHGVSPTHAGRIRERFGDDALRVVREEPHRLAREIRGIGFRTADQMARAAGLADDAPDRLAAGLLHALHQAADRGHVVRARSELLGDAKRLLEQPETLIAPVLDALATAGDVVAVVPPAAERSARVREPVYALPWLERAEVGLARGLRDLDAQGELPLRIDVEAALDWFGERAGFELAPSQRKALGRALVAKRLVVTGGPGTGKTTLVRGIVEILQAKQQRVVLAAPTGRAAQRLTEATGTVGKTIHRLLEYQGQPGAGGGFARGPDHPLAADVVVVDEASMLDVQLAHALVRALPSGARLILVGDVDQLPSIGPGRVLADLIESDTLEVVRLAQVFRQSATGRAGGRPSLIVENAHRIKAGLHPAGGSAGSASAGSSPGLDDTDDYFWIERQSPEAILETLLHLVVERIPAHFGFDPKRDVQVLAPMRRGLLGTANLNAELQARLNPDGDTISRGAGVLRVGDRVMQRRNDYDLGVSNGDIGRVLAFDKAERRASIDFEGRIVTYPFAALDALTLSYACSIHKSQGSEYPAVVLPLHTQHFQMLRRNLLYTAVTRGKRLVVGIGSRRALEIAVSTGDSDQRGTLLIERLQGRL